MQHDVNRSVALGRTAPAGIAPRQWWAVALALISLGIGIRVWRVFFAGLPLRVDEIRVAWNLFDRGLVDLIRPLDHQQAAPVGFLWLVDSTVALLGQDAWVLRLVPLLAGCALLLVLAYVARQALHDYVAWGVVLLASLNAILIMQATDLKQYSMDALVSAALLAATIPAMKPEAPTRARVIFGAAGALGLMMSHGAFFVASGLGLMLGALALVTRDRRALIQILGVAGVWIVVVGLLYWFNLRFTVGRHDLMTYWAPDFAPLPAQEGAWDWYSGIPRRLAYACGLAWKVQPVFGVVLLLGVFGAALRDRRWLAAIVVPFLLVFGTALAGQYPFAGRMIAFFAPFTLLLIGFGCQLMLERINRLGQVLILTSVLWAILTSFKLGTLFDGGALGTMLNWVDSCAKTAASAVPWMMAFFATIAVLSSLARKVGRSVAGHSWIAIQSNSNRYGGSLIAVLILWGIGATLPFSQITRPWKGGRYDLDRPFAMVASHRQSGDGLIVEKRLYHPYKFYAEEYRLPPSAPLLHLPYYQGDPKGQAMRDEALRHNRVWILTAVKTSTGRRKWVITEDLLLPLLEEFGPPTLIEQTSNVIAWLFERDPETIPHNQETSLP